MQIADRLQQCYKGQPFRNKGWLKALATRLPEMPPSPGCVDAPM